MNNTKSHVAIVGAGFAGLVAARELESLGAEVSIFEARNRIGGRAWTDERLGIDLEMGATWVHWYQPFIWTEIMRYGKKIYPSPSSEKVYWIADGERYEGNEEQAAYEQYRVESLILKDSKRFFPFPYEPTYVLDSSGELDETGKDFIAADDKSVLDLLSERGGTQKDLDIADSYWSAAFQGPADEGSSLMAVHQAALSDHRMPLLDDITLKYKLVGGMKGLYESIASDLQANIKLNAGVKRIEEDGEATILEFNSGERQIFDAVIVTAPTAALRNITFVPALSFGQQNLVHEGSNSRGVKAWIKIRGVHKILLTAPRPAPLTILRTEYWGEDWSILVGFGPDNEAIDLTSVESAQSVLDYWDLGLQAIGIAGHDWVADEWSGQTWSTPKKGQFLDGRHHFRKSSGRIRFAGSDWAYGWNGVFVDGAIESGIQTARSLAEELL